MLEENSPKDANKNDKEELGSSRPNQMAANMYIGEGLTREQINAVNDMKRRKN